ncbi:MAG: TerC family protein, partial [Gemmatimonadetes bacterium]|nr:TerC family protein [Gemmatimonadota bacterium]
LGLLLAMFLRIALLFTIAWMMNLTADLFTVLGNGISGRDLILLI